MAAAYSGWTPINVIRLSVISATRIDELSMTAVLKSQMNVVIPVRAQKAWSKTAPG